MSELDFVTSSNPKTGKSSTTLMYPDEFVRMPGAANFSVVDGKGNRTDGNTIILPLPEGLAYADAASYENADLGSIGGQFAEGETIEAFKSLIETFRGGGASDIGTSVLSRFTGNRTRARLGKTPNPNTRALFKQVNMRQFAFNYKFVPSSPAEAETVQKIIKSFRSELYPTGDAATDDDGFRIAYNFPNRYQIRFFLGNQEEERYEVEPKLLPCYLTAITTTYNTKTILKKTPASGSAKDQLIDGLLNGGAPGDEASATYAFGEVDLNLTFLESKTLLSSDILDGGF